MASTLRLGGFDEFLTDLARLAPDLAAAAAPLARTIAEQSATQIRAAYPVRTGALRASVTVAREPSSSPARVYTAVRVGVPYAEHVEFGTARTPPRPAFIPITRRGREAFVRAVIAEVRDRGFTVTGEGV
jgi:hypothetical protein